MRKYCFDAYGNLRKPIGPMFLALILLATFDLLILSLIAVVNLFTWGEFHKRLSLYGRVA